MCVWGGGGAFELIFATFATYEGWLQYLFRKCDIVMVPLPQLPQPGAEAQRYFDFCISSPR